MIFIDTETTGLLKPAASLLTNQPFIIEICCIQLDDNGEYIGQVDTLIKPPIPIPEEVIKISGITDEMVVDSPTFIEIYDDLCNLFLGETKLIAHNAPFDIGVLKYELERHDKEFKFPWPRWHICTVEKSMPIKNKRLKLVQLHKMATGRDQIDGAHRAANDVHALIRSYRYLVDKGLI